MGHAELQPEDIDETISPLHSAIKRTWISFCATTSIHGLKYIKDEQTNKTIKIIWIIISIVMFICAIVMVHTFYIDYRSNPTRMNVENDYAPITSIQIPAVTVCPEVPFNIRKAKAFLERIKLPKGSSIDNVLDGLQIFNGFFVDDERYTQKELQMMENLLLLNNLSITAFANEIRWDCRDLLVRCRLHGKIEDCDQLFQNSRTFLGHCCSFNIKQQGTSFTDKYAQAGIRTGLSLILSYSDINFKRFRSYSLGFKLFITEHAAFPSAHANIKFLPLNEEVFVAVRTTETFCSQSVHDLSIEARQCVFSEEFPLRFFPYYVSPNCELNCRALNMLKYCGCMAFFFPINFTIERECSFKDIPCLVENFGNIVGRYRQTQCPCPSPCEYFNYDVQLSSAKLQIDLPTMDEFYNDIKDGYAVAHIFMNSQVYRRIRHDLLSNTVTLVSNLGSAFSLFVGMSMVSTVEIIYYFTVVLHKFYTEEIKTREKLSFRKSTKIKAAKAIEKTKVRKLPS